MVLFGLVVLGQKLFTTGNPFPWLWNWLELLTEPFFTWTGPGFPGNSLLPRPSSGVCYQVVLGYNLFRLLLHEFRLWFSLSSFGFLR